MSSRFKLLNWLSKLALQQKLQIDWGSRKSELELGSDNWAEIETMTIEPRPRPWLTPKKSRNCESKSQSLKRQIIF